MAPTKVEIHFVDGTRDLEITSKLTGQQLLEDMCTFLKMAPAAIPGMPHMFGFAYRDKKDFAAFVKEDKKIMSQDVNKKEVPLQFHFRVKFYPESVTDEMKDPVSARLFWKQIKLDIVNGDIYSPPELCVLFAGQSMQAEFGDYDAGKHGAGTVVVASQLPERVIAQHGLSTDQWEERVVNAWKAQSGVPQDVAVMDYLTIAQDLEQYGITYFEIRNKKGTRLWLGVHNLGMDIYEEHNKVTPRLGFPWGEIRNISFNDKKFTIKMVAKEAPDFKFLSPQFKINKRILELCVGNHTFFIGRRRLQVQGEFAQEDRATLEAKLRKTKEQLLAIRMDLEKVKDASKITKEEQESRKNEAQGMDKFKTMKKAQSGDAKRRIMEFEALEAEC